MDEGTLARLASGLPVPVESIPVYDLPFLTLNMCVLLVITYIYIYSYINICMYICVFFVILPTHTQTYTTQMFCGAGNF